MYSKIKPRAIKMYRYILLISLCSFLTNHAIGQISFIQSNDITIIKNSNTLGSPWAGGINFAQFSKVDLDLDGADDLLVFDRSGKNGTKNGNKIMPFLYKSANNTYKYAPEYITSFPPIKDWALMVDYNQDNKADLFTSSDNSIALYTNISNDFLEFEFSKIITSDAGFGPINIYVNSNDLPAIVDVDGDTDIDILSFDPSGSYIYFHENKSTELYNNSDSIQLTRSDNCWGKFREDFSTNSVTLGLNDDCIPNNAEMRVGHSGSTVLALDLDPENDQGLELLLGDITYNNMVMLYNGDDNDTNSMYSQDVNFPSYDQPINITRFPGAFYLDIDNDNLRDLIISPNGVNVSENHKNCLLYKNQGINTSNYYEFEFIENDFLIKDMIDVGTNSHPILYDLNNDNLLDLIISNKGYFDNGNYNSRISLFKNTGTIYQPVFELITEDFNNISEIGNLANIQSLHPTFGDLNNDGEIDMIIGNNNGEIYYFENEGNDSEWPSYSEYIILNIDVGSFSTPQLVDLNRDGLLDLIIGERMGVDNGVLNGINYFQNTGTINSPDFTDYTPEFTHEDGTIIKSLGAIHLADETYLTAYTAPHIFETNGLYQLAIGTESGNVYLYDNIEIESNGDTSLNIESEFNLLLENILNTNNCIHSKISILDIDNNETLDLFRGNANGGIELFQGSSNNAIINHIIPENLKISPNPNNGTFKIELEKYITKIVSLYSNKGQLLYRIQTQLNKIEINDLNTGLYIVKIETENTKFIEKIVVTK
ncbi:T9SS type A sorting domain-containing protein [Flavobacteriales bacterium]|nr:T9SS type A sorting domain-containing protein [Flavobacteriales bacterium]